MFKLSGVPWDMSLNSVQDRWASDITPLKNKKTGPKSANYTQDIEFTGFLLRDLSNLVCLDTSRVYAVGLGTGGGMMQFLACDDHLSKSFAAFASIAGGYGAGKKGRAPWGVCKSDRKHTPVLEVHGMEDKIFGYYLTEGENGKIRRIPPHWVEEWSERNGCGEAVGDAVQSTVDESTFITKLENGIMTETIQFGGSAVRIARKCFSSDEGKATKDFDVVGALEDKDTTVLHYQVMNYGHGWPRLQLRKEHEVMFKDKQIQVKSENQFFDTTKIVMSFFNSHRLPQKWATRKPAPGSEMPSDEMMEKQLREMEAKQGLTPMSDKDMKAQVAAFRKSQGPVGEVVEEKKADRDEL
jgi:poly(3-hydroxybutyrate) depolymerase